jgi:putative salt-induced outer membrane protein YdiY
MRNAGWVFALLLALAPPVLADDVELANGDTLRGTIVEWKDATIVFDHPLLGRLEIARDRIVHPAAPGATGDSEPGSASEAAPPQPPGLFGSGLLAGWNRNLALGMSGSQGKSVEASFNSQLTASYEDDRDRWRFDTAYFFSSVDGEAKTNELYTQLGKDWLLADSRWLFFLEGRYDHDPFRDWDHRIAGSSGVGYQLVKRERWDLLGRVGIGANRTIGGEEASSPEGVAGFEADWRIADGQTLRATTFLFPDASEFGEFRTRSTLDWILAISPSYGLSLKLSINNEYESIAEDEKNDFRYVGSLMYDF